MYFFGFCLLHLFICSFIVLICSCVTSIDHVIASFVLNSWYIQSHSTTTTTIRKTYFLFTFIRNAHSHCCGRHVSVCVWAAQGAHCLSIMVWAYVPLWSCGIGCSHVCHLNIYSFNTSKFEYIHTFIQSPKKCQCAHMCPYLRHSHAYVSSWYVEHNMHLLHFNTRYTIQ